MVFVPLFIAGYFYSFLGIFGCWITLLTGEREPPSLCDRH